MNLQELIDRGGSKPEITRALIEAQVDIPIPNSIWLYFGQDVASIRSEFEQMKKPVIVRGSHKNDYHGFIDVVPTVKNVESFSDLENAVRSVYKRMYDFVMRTHAQDWGQKYSKEVHLLIQEQSLSPYTGFMMRHPHDRKQLRIQYIGMDPDKHRFKPFYFAIIGKHGFSHSASSLGDAISDEEIWGLIDMFERLENSGIVDSSFSQQMEFGLRPLLFYQARPFKLFEPAKDFDLPEKFNSGGNSQDIYKYPYIYSRECFGITPEKGVSLPFIFMNVVDIFRGRDVPLNIEQPYGLVLLDTHSESYPLGTHLGNIKAFCSECSKNTYLFHGTYRFMKKADFSLIDFDVLGIKDPQQLNEFSHSKLFSNGTESIIIPEKYL